MGKLGEAAKQYQKAIERDAEWSEEAKWCVMQVSRRSKSPRKVSLIIAKIAKQKTGSKFPLTLKKTS